MNFKTILKIGGIIGALYMFLVGINGMSSAIKHMGSDFANVVISTTSDPLIALFIGIFATVLFQSSSTTTSLIVGMVSSGSLLLNSAIPMIMGANIGTTVTNTLVSIGHINRDNEFKRAFAASTIHDFFNILAVIILFPLEMKFHMIQKSAESFATLLFGKIQNVDVLTAKSPIKIAIKSGSQFVESITFHNDIGYLVLSIFITFAMLFSLVKLLRSLVLKKIEVFFDKIIFKTAVRAIIFGIIITVMVQSSSITTSIIVPLAGAGVLTLRQIFPFTLGANIGTTVTALLASLAGTIPSMVAAFCHLIFNIFGIMIIYVIPPFRKIPLFFAEKISEISVHRKYVPVIYLAIIFVLIPFMVIYFGR